VSVRVVEVSGVATVQDLGRPGLAHQGVPRGGAADALSLRLANRAVGNAEGAAAVECTMGRLVVEAEAECLVVASSGARAFEPVRLRMGEAIEVSPDPGLCRVYLAVSGGIDVPVVLGSRSTLVGAGLGGLEGRRLSVGDRLALGRDGAELRSVPAHLRAMADFTKRRRALRVTREAAEASLPNGLLRVSGHSDRVGVRLERVGGGEPIDTGPSRGTLYGTIQAPSSGEFIVLGPDGPTTGGYAVVGTVIAADLPAVGQLAPGQWIGFEVVDRAEAVRLLGERERVMREF
jgi:biotin-dependent carboxylase-like uncharacterized protein